MRRINVIVIESKVIKSSRIQVEVFAQASLFLAEGMPHCWSRARGRWWSR
jgi:hypothetical protein